MTKLWRTSWEASLSCTGMIGTVVVMEPDQYQAWLADTPQEITRAESGRRLFDSLGCATCHGQQGPTMTGVYLRQRRMANGETVVADDAYLREAILDAPAKLVEGFAPIMPSYRNQISEEQLMDLIAYIRSLQDPKQQKAP